MKTCKQAVLIPIDTHQCSKCGELFKYGTSAPWWAYFIPFCIHRFVTVDSHYLYKNNIDNYKLVTSNDMDLGKVVSLDSNLYHGKIKKFFARKRRERVYGRMHKIYD